LKQKVGRAAYERGKRRNEGVVGAKRVRDNKERT